MALKQNPGPCARASGSGCCRSLKDGSISECDCGSTYRDPALALPALPGRAIAERFYRPELDLLRFCAFLMVWAAHALLSFQGLLPEGVLQILEGAGSCGVPIFFFLSAFLITELLRREALLAGEIRVRSFYLRRMFRIWPLYFSVLAVYGLMGLRFHGFFIEPGRLLTSALLAGNWYIALHPTITTPMRSLWSISVEEQWYLLWPLLRRGLSTRALLGCCCATFAFSYVLLAGLAHAGRQGTLHVTAWVNSGVQFQFLALGAAAALLLGGQIPRLGPSSRSGLAIVGAASLLAASGLCRFKTPAAVHTSASLCCGYLLVALGTSALFVAVFGLPNRICPRLLVRLGQLSFGLYVFHETGFFLANALVRRASLPLTLSVLAGEKVFALGLTVAMAFASYHVLELPFLRFKQRWTTVRSREAA